MTLNTNLKSAQRNRNDEFYTQLKDIEEELKHYRHHFKDKIVYCNADDPRVSNFFHYFSYNFEYLGLKKLITTCYKNQNMDLFSMHDQEKAIALIYEGEKDNGRVPTIENIGVIELEGDGDFRSSEAINFLKEADIVVTNPPFSLFREYISQLFKYDKDFLVIGNFNSVTYKEVFPLIRDNKIWTGVSPRSMKFTTPEGEIKTVNAKWFTNLDIKKRHEELILYKKYDKDYYQHYDNCNAINIDKISDIPMDYAGLMGVPITFLEVYNPNQFEIIGITKTWDNFATKIYPKQIQVSSNGKKSEVSKLNDGGVIKLNKPPEKGTYYLVNGEVYIQKYARILIKNKKVV